MPRKCFLKPGVPGVLAVKFLGTDYEQREWQTDPLRNSAKDDTTGCNSQLSYSSRGIGNQIFFLDVYIIGPHIPG
jgi:hypothetical protein